MSFFRLIPGIILWSSGVLVSLVIFALELLFKSQGKIRRRPGQNTLDPGNRRQINNGNFIPGHPAAVIVPKPGGTKVSRSDIVTDIGIESQEY